MLFATFAIITIYVLKYGNCNIPSIITPVMLICKFLIATDSEKRKTVTAALFKSVFFRLHQICTIQNHKIKIFLSIIVIFLGYSTQILTKGQLKVFLRASEEGIFQNQ